MSMRATAVGLPYNPMADSAFSKSSSDSSSWLPTNNLLTRVMGFSLFASLFPGMSNSASGMGSQADPYRYLWDSARLFLLGLLIETGRRFCQWVIARVRFQYSITAEFSEGDPAYEWLILFLTDAQIWKQSREFRVSAVTSSTRKWSVKAPSSSSKEKMHIPLLGDTHALTGSNTADPKDGNVKITSDEGPHAEYVPTFQAPQLFRWKGYWVEIMRENGKTFNPMLGHQAMAVMYLTMYTSDMSVLSSFVEEARLGYIKTSRPHVIVHTADQPNFSPHFTWSLTKSKPRRPLSSIILQETLIHSLLDDLRDFLSPTTAAWYMNAGIPYRRGYLLHGPPGTGKSSTIVALAGELGVEVYSLSLGSNFVDDAFLSRAVSAVPKNSIFLIEDIDCAFPIPRSDDDDDSADSGMGMGMRGGRMTRNMAMGMGMVVPASGMMGMGMGDGRRSAVTLSGLLNVLDGVSSEEGKIFFATTNHINHLDPALLRPGRIDKKIQYKLATQAQAEALFLRFYDEGALKRELAADAAAAADASNTSSDPEKSSSSHLEKTEAIQPTDLASHLASLARTFSLSIPAHEFSTAELQGFLLLHKVSPGRACREAPKWVEEEMGERERAKAREMNKRKRAQAQGGEGQTQAPGAGVPAGPVPLPLNIPLQGAMPLAPLGSISIPTPMPTRGVSMLPSPPNTAGSMMMGGGGPVEPSPTPAAPAVVDARGPMPEVGVVANGNGLSATKPLVNGVSSSSEDH